MINTYVSLQDNIKFPQFGNDMFIQKDSNRGTFRACKFLQWILRTRKGKACVQNQQKGNNYVYPEQFKDKKP